MSQPKHRILTSFHSTGPIGQSTLKQGLISWLGFAAIDFSAVDAAMSTELWPLGIAISPHLSRIERKTIYLHDL